MIFRQHEAVILFVLVLLLALCIVTSGLVIADNAPDEKESGVVGAPSTA